MSMADRQPMPPHLVEVVAADSIDDVVADIVAELAVLEEELDQLTTTAGALERRLRESAWAGCDEAAAGPLLRRVCDEQTAAARAAMAAALEAAVREADERVAAARTAAATMTMNQGGGSEAEAPASPSVPRVAFERAPSVQPAQRPGPSVVEVASQQAPRAAGLAPTADPPKQPDGETRPADATRTALPVTPADPGRSVELTEDAHAAFGEFWVADATEAPETGIASSVVDAVLPLVALLIVVVIVLSWIG